MENNNESKDTQTWALLSANENLLIDKLNCKLDRMFGKEKINWQKVSDTKELIAFHEGRKSVYDSFCGH